MLGFSLKMYVNPPYFMFEDFRRQQKWSHVTSPMWFLQRTWFYKLGKWQNIFNSCRKRWSSWKSIDSWGNWKLVVGRVSTHVAGIWPRRPDHFWTLLWQNSNTRDNADSHSFFSRSKTSRGWGVSMTPLAVLRQFCVLFNWWPKMLRSAKTTKRLDWAVSLCKGCEIIPVQNKLRLSVGLQG